LCTGEAKGGVENREDFREQPGNTRSSTSLGMTTVKRAGLE